MSNEFGISGKKVGFSGRRMTAVMKRVMIQLVRDRRTFGMILIMPLLIMLIFGYALSGEVKNVPVILINEDEGFGQFNIGNNFTDNLGLDDRVSIKDVSKSWTESVNLVEEGEYTAVIHIPTDFTKNVIMKSQNVNANISANIEIYIDGTKPAIRGSVLGAIQEAIQNSMSAQIIEIDETLAFGNAEYSGLDVAIPAVIGLVLTFLILLVSLVTIIREQLYGTQTRLYTTPLTKIERLIGFTLALSFVGLIMALVVMGIGVFGFDAEVSGNAFLLIFSAFLYAIVHILLAVFLSNFAKNELQAVQFAPMIAFPSMALSGMLVPLNTLPEFAQILAQFIPMTYGIKIFEGIMLKGLSFVDLWYEYLIMMVFGILMLTLAIITVKDKME